MSYYIISEDGGQVLESSSTMSETEIQEAADYFGCDVYAIRGEHSGYSAVCSRPTEPASNAAEVALIEGPMTPRQVIDKFEREYPRCLQLTDKEKDALAVYMSAHFTPHLPMVARDKAKGAEQCQ